MAFLRYNFNPATIFLGDCGSLLIGFLLGCYGVLWSQKSATILGMTAPILALSIPLLDTSLAVFGVFFGGAQYSGPIVVTFIIGCLIVDLPRAVLRYCFTVSVSLLDYFPYRC